MASIRSWRRSRSAVVARMTLACSAAVTVPLILDRYGLMPW
ncbi:hypothetical protein [Micromonospora sp. WMMD714]|nr:hypothetical protein [Micromonospora sp. WMMD714]WFE62825.1 hypothetical protein O7625_05775 [Micromonospora sp. WMMD714]